MEDSKVDSFFTDFSLRVNDKVLSHSLVCIFANQEAFKALSLEDIASAELWGILIFCQRDTYFYVSKNENYISVLLRSFTKEKERKDTFIKLPTQGNDNKISFSLPQKKWYNFLLPNYNHTIFASFQSGEKNHQYKITTIENAKTVYEKLQKY